MDVWIGKDGERLGPYPEVDVREKIRSGVFARDDLGWYDGLADWQPLAVLFVDEQPATPSTAVPSATPPTFTGPAPPHDHARVLPSYAGFWKRVAAYVIDVLVLYIPNLLIEKITGAAVAQTALSQAMAASAGNPQMLINAYGAFYHAMLPTLMVQTVLAWLYFALCQSSSLQATLGKLALGIRVTDIEGRRISFARASGRFFARIPSAMIFCIGYLMVAWTARKQGLHDLLAGTLVVNGRPGEVINHDASVHNQRRASDRPKGSFDA